MQAELAEVGDPCLSRMDSEEFTAEGPGKCIADYLDAVKQHYIVEWKTAKEERDRLDAELAGTFEDRAAYARYTSLKHNEAIDKLVRNADSGSRIVYAKDELVRKYEPVFQKANGLTAHFYAARKSLFGWEMDTFWFNVLVIWLMTASLYVTLYFKVFRRVLRLFSR
jgi:hypothetical protein